MKKVILILLLFIMHSVAYGAVNADLQATYKRWACANTCTKAYTETETNYFGNKVTYKCVACKYNFCMLPTGEQIFFEYNSYGKINQNSTYPFVFRWVQY